jgi:hypothetical protein
VSRRTHASSLSIPLRSPAPCHRTRASAVSTFAHSLQVGDSLSSLGHLRLASR